jgi:hypothetical protein
MVAENGDGYSYASEPRAVSLRKKERGEHSPQTAQSPGLGDERLANNIMWDKRVVRGSTRPGTQGSQQEHGQQSPTSSGRNGSSARHGQPQLSASSRDRARRSRGGAPGRHEAPVWIPAEPLPESMMEEILDRPIEIYEVSTDKGADRPPSPIFIPQSAGVDTATQVEDGDLFDFDVEVENILDILVGRTLQQSLLECDEEDMLFEELTRVSAGELVRAVELSEAQRREMADDRRNAERDRRSEQLVKAEAEEAKRARDVAARGISFQTVSDVVGEMFKSLDAEGFFPDPLMTEIEQVFMPWLLDGVGAKVDSILVEERRAEALVRGALELHEAKRGAADTAYHEILARIEAQKAEEKRLAEEASAASAAAEAEPAEGADGEAPAE